MAEHHASVTVNAPVHQVYSLFTHFNDFPKFMSFVKEVTYYDDQRSHWVAEVVGRHEWDAVNEDWIEDQQIGWHSTNGLTNSGRVTFQPSSAMQTLVDVYVSYDPPAGVLGAAGEALGAGSRFESVLQHDLTHFAQMVEQAPEGALDPMSSSYLFHGDSAAARGTTTTRQNDSMVEDTAMNQTGGVSSAVPNAYPAGTTGTTGYSGTTGTTGYSGTSGTNDYSSTPGNASVTGTPYTTDQDIINESPQGLGGTPGQSYREPDQGYRTEDQGYRTTEQSFTPSDTSTNATTDTDYGTPVDMQDSSMATGRDEGSGSTNPRDLSNAGGGPNVGAGGLSSSGTTGRDTTLDDRTATGTAYSGNRPNSYSGTGEPTDRRTMRDRQMLENENMDPAEAGQPLGDRDARARRVDPTDPMQPRNQPNSENY